MSHAFSYGEDSSSITLLTSEELNLVSGGIFLEPLAQLLAAIGQGAAEGGVAGAAGALTTGGSVSLGGLGGMAAGGVAGGLNHLTKPH